jgi:uncharacterized spore protein YtfJ
MKLPDALQHAADVLTVKRVFGEPFEKDGLTVIPAAVVWGGGGGGEGHDPNGQEGQGGGFGLIGRPAGAYVISNGQVEWRPALDPNRVIALAAMVTVTYLLSRPRLVRAKALRDSTD